jgi:hypothetical protein
MEVVYNGVYGGFSLSKEAADLIATRLKEAGRDSDPGCEEDWHPCGMYRALDRADPILVSVVKELGAKANGPHSFLAIEKLPEEWKGCYAIEEYDGNECVRFNGVKYALQHVKALLESWEERTDHKAVLDDVVDKLKRCY